jgi:hypothetical protein
MEGDAIEGVIAIVLIILTVIVLFAYLSLRNLDPATAIAEAMSKVADFFKQLWSGLTVNGSVPGGSVLNPLGDFYGDDTSAQVSTGTDWGA